MKMKMENFTILLLLGAGLLTFAVGQYQYDSTQTTVARDIQECYRDERYYHGFHRLPMHIDNFISIVRKIEDKTKHLFLDMRTITRTILKRYQFDGIIFDKHIAPELAFRRDSLEAQKTAIIHEMIGGGANDIFPEGMLEPAERCSLHWMMSHSLNATLREEEIQSNYQSGGGSGSGGRKPTNPRYKRSENNDEWATDVGKDVDLFKEREEFNPSNDGKTSTTKRLARQVAGGNEPQSLEPIESGVVYTSYGAVSIGRVLAGIIAGLEPSSRSVGEGGYRASDSPQNGSPNFNENSGGGFFGLNGGQQPFGGESGFGTGGSGGGGGFNAFPNNNNNNNGYNNNNNDYRYKNGRKKRQAFNGGFQPLENLHAATLAGDVGQAAILNAPYTQGNHNVGPPVGYWNDTVCPKNYYLNKLPGFNQGGSYQKGTYSYMTGAEILGGIDGLVLGSNIRNWDSLGFKLSTVLYQYYGNRGVNADPEYRACNRNSKLSGSIDGEKIRQQSFSFAYLYNNRTHAIPYLPKMEKFSEYITNTYNKMQSFASSYGNFQCARIPGGGGDQNNDNDKPTEINTNLHVVMDPRLDNREMEQQLKFIGQLAHEIDIKPRGSRIALINPRITGNSTVISANNSDSGSVYACRIATYLSYQGNNAYDIPRVLDGLKREFEQLRTEEARYDHLGFANGITILFMVQGGRLEETQRTSVHNKIREFSDNLGDVHVMFASSKQGPDDFNGFYLNKAYDFLQIQNALNLSDSAPDFAAKFSKLSHGRLMYPRCNKNHHDQANEHRQETVLFVSPGNIQYYKISPDYFYSSRKLLLRFTSENGKARVCISRSSRFPNTQNGGTCRESQGVYNQAGASNWRDIEFSYDKPCGRNGDRQGCGPIYISISPTTFSSQNEMGLDCNIEGCESSNQVKVGFSHWDMRCNNGLNNLGNSLLIALLSIAAIFSYIKSSS